MSRCVSIFILLFLAAFSHQADAQNIYLLSVGVADYPGDRNDLVLPAEDAKAIYELFKKNGKVTASLLTDSKATRKAIVASAESLFQKAEKDDIVIFFFSGHGERRGFCAYDGILKYSSIRRVFSKCKAANKMIFADSCLSGALREVSKDHYRDPNNNIMLFLSSRSNELSNEAIYMKNGYFTTCLLRALRGGADTDRDRIITAKELFVSVSKSVTTLSKDSQHPVMWGNFDDNMPVMVWK
ncbi:MAG: caspase family protein [Bacteroidales bacterium]|nr:caspase family protein [Bacteroidales bacterium]